MEKFYEKFQKSKKNGEKLKEPKKNRASLKEFNYKKAEKPIFKDFSKESFDASLILKDGMKDFGFLGKNEKYVLENFDEIVQHSSPLSAKQLLNLPKCINSLSHSLTDDRENRRLGYMNSVEDLSAYTRYFSWWNIVRLVKVFSKFREEDFNLSDEDFCADLGSGPLTVVISLWLSFPKLRNLKLTWYCLDISSKALSLGEDLYYSVAAKCPPPSENAEPSWNIIRVKGELGTNLKNKVKLITAANMFNEINQNTTKTYESCACESVKTLLNYAKGDASFFIFEPGLPNAAHFISLCRSQFILNGKSIFAPCTHIEKCCMNGKNARKGGKSKWCNFALTTEDSPKKLLKLSDSANLSKTRLTMSFIFAGTKKYIEEKDSSVLSVRIASDSFLLPPFKSAFYACSEKGFLIICDKKNCGIKSGDLLQIKLNKKFESLPLDSKSGAKIIVIG